jgi:hypothetical protein
VLGVCLVVEGDGLRGQRGRRAGKSGPGPAFGDVPPHEVGRGGPVSSDAKSFGDLVFEFSPLTGLVTVTSLSGVLLVSPVSPGVARLSSRRREGVPGVVS